ncbi:transposase IS66 family protein [Nephila pilipes]|uniref:Transposase IS66 family protein n=1 Tax=Nephila pilipes TaxID=299642 RepID=A0A8X6I4U0_NEPPI|nr:transposase IS66 family protein [Nephila pilipes]
MTTALQGKIVAENANLKEEIKALSRENDSLKAKIVELEDKLGLNSQNSSLPPSRDIYRKKGKKKSDKNPGGQPGHKAHKRELMAADEVVSCIIDKILGGDTALHLAARNGHKGFVELLLDNGTNVNSVSSTGSGVTLLHEAAFYGHVGVARNANDMVLHSDAKTGIATHLMAATLR